MTSTGQLDNGPGMQLEASPMKAIQLYKDRVPIVTCP